MNRILSVILAAVTMLMAVSCKEELNDNGPVRFGNGRIQLTVDGIMGEYGDVPGIDTKASLVTNVRVAWQNGDEVYVYDGQTCLGILEAGIKDGDDRIAVLRGSIDEPASGTSVLTLVCCSGVSAEPEVKEGKIGFDLTEQNGKDIPFVVYATIPYEGIDISGTAVPFKFATSVMKVNVTGLKAGSTVQNATVSDINTRCVLTLSSSAAPAVSGDAEGTITRSGNEAFSLSGDGRGTFQLATVVSPASTSRMLGITDSSSHLFSTKFTASALAAGKSYNSVFALVQVPNCVDLGLPSGIKWADMNLGGQDFGNGDLYAWGETKPRASFNWDNYSFCDPATGLMTKYTQTDCNLVLDAEDDAATVELGPDWRTPTFIEWDELQSNCKISVETVDGVKVLRFTSKVSGYEDSSITLAVDGLYWTSLKMPASSEEESRQALAMEPLTDIGSMLSMVCKDRCEGHFIRPICSKHVEATSISLQDFTVGIGEDDAIAVPVTLFPENCTELGMIFEVSDPSIARVSSSGIITGLKDGLATLTVTWADNPAITASCAVLVTAAAASLVDLGLESGTKWASHDLQASFTFEAGPCFAWGETQSKETFELGNYKWYDSVNEEYTKYNSADGLTALEATDDAATAMLGSGWSIPTKADWDELINDCEWSWINTFKLLRATGPNGNSIMFKCPNDPEYPGTWYHATYWTSELASAPYYTGAVQTVYLSRDSDDEQEDKISHDFTTQSCYDGYPVRPVFKQ